MGTWNFAKALIFAALVGCGVSSQTTCPLPDASDDHGLVETGKQYGTIIPYAFPIGPASGDMTGTYPSPGVGQCSGVAGTCSILASNLSFGTSVTNPTLTQSALASDVAPQPMLVLAQSAFPSATTNKTGAALILESGSGATTNGSPGSVGVLVPALSGTGTAGLFSVTNAGHVSFSADPQGVVLGRTDASQQGIRIAPLIGNETSNVAIWTGANATAPTGGNYSVAFNTAAGTDLFAHGLQSMAGGTVLLQNTSPYINFAQTIATPTIGQAQQANGSNPNNTVVAPQAPGAGAASTATGTPGSFVVNLAAPVSTGNDANLLVQVGGTTLAALGRYNKTSTVGGLWLGNNATAPSNTNHSLFSDNANNTVLNAPSAAGTVFFRINNAAAMGVYTANGVQLFSETTSFGGGTGILGMSNVTTAPTANPVGGLAFWVSTGGGGVFNILGTSGQALQIGLNQGLGLGYAWAPLVASGTGANAGLNSTILAQNGQQQTGANANNNGGTLALSSGQPGTGGSGTAGVAGPVQLDTGLTVEMTVGPTASGGGPAGLGYTNQQTVTITAAVNTTFTLTQAQYAAPYVILSGTLTSAAVATIALPNVTSTWWFDDSGVTFTSGSIKWTCGGGTASASISSLVTTTELILVSCRGTTVVIGVAENDVETDWRYASVVPANDNQVDPCDRQRQAA